MNNDNDFKLVEVLSKHYTETFDLLKTVVARRDRLFLYILLVIFIVLLYMSNPSVMSDWVNSFFSSKVVGNDTTTKMTPLIDVSVIGVVLLLGLLSLSHTYFQTVLHIERQYDYVYQLEDNLGGYFNDNAFTREGKHYRKYKRKFSSWTRFIFWYLFPILYLAFIILWLWFLFTTSQTPFGYKVVDFLITASILVSLGLYLMATIKRK